MSGITTLHIFNKGGVIFKPANKTAMFFSSLIRYIMYVIPTILHILSQFIQVQFLHPIQGCPITTFPAN